MLMWCRYCSWKNYPKKTSLLNWWVMDCGGWVFWDFWAFWPGGFSCTAIFLLLSRCPQQSCCRNCRGLCLGNWRHDCCDCQPCFLRAPPPPRSCFETGPYGMQYGNRSAVPAEWAIDSRAKPSYTPKDSPCLALPTAKYGRLWLRFLRPTDIHMLALKPFYPNAEEERALLFSCSKYLLFDVCLFLLKEGHFRFNI